MVNSLLVIFTTLLLHPVHLSMSSLNRVEEADGYSLVVKMNNDDLAIEMARLYKSEDIVVDDHNFRFTGPDSLIERYINEHIEITLNKKRVGATFSDKEELPLETIVTLWVPFSAKARKVSIKNLILTELYPDQVNLFIFNDRGFENAIRFTASMQAAEFKCKKTNTN